MGRQRKEVAKTVTTVSAAVSDAFAQIEELREELQNWYDNMPEGPKNGDKGSMLDEAISTLGSNSEPEIPEYVGEMRVEYIPGGKRKKSRADRRDEAVTMLTAAAARAEDVAEDEEEDEDVQEEARNFAEELRDAISEWEAVEFPGMMG